MKRQRAIARSDKTKENKNYKMPIKEFRKREKEGKGKGF